MNIPFLDTVLGTNGSAAIQRAISKNSSLADIIMPRVLLSWINNIGVVGFEGKVPGTAETFLVLEKTENGFDGAVTIDNKLFTFNNSSSIHVAASIGVAIGSNFGTVENLNKHDVEKIGQSIDVLVKTNIVRNIQKEYLDTLDYGDFTIEYTDNLDSPYLVKYEPTGKIVAEGLLKIEDAKKAAGIAVDLFKAHQESLAEKKLRLQHPGQPNFDKRKQGAQKKQSQFAYDHIKLPKRPNKGVSKNNKVKVNRGVTRKSCDECGENLFKNEKFTACMCLSEFKDLIKLEKTGEEYFLNFSNSMEEEDIAAVFEIIQDL